MTASKFILTTVVLLWCQTASPGDASEFALAWKPIGKAITEAKANKKLVMIVQGPGELTGSVQRNDTAQSYLRGALRDPLAKDFFDFRVIAHYQPSGLDSKQRMSKRLRKQLRIEEERTVPTFANFVTYFCYPNDDFELETLHFFVGQPTSQQLQNNCEFASDLLLALQNLSPKARLEACRNTHRAKLFSDDDVPDKTLGIQFNEAIQETARVRDARLLSRFGEDWTDGEISKLIGSLRPHADLEDTSAHRMLTMFPLTLQSKLAKPVYEELTRQRYDRPASIASWLLQQRQRKRALLFSVLPANAKFRPPPSGVFLHSEWNPSRKQLMQLFEKVDRIDIPPRELAALLTDFGLTKHTERQFNDFRYVILPVDVDREAVYVKRGENALRLERTLEEILKWRKVLER